MDRCEAHRSLGLLPPLFDKMDIVITQFVEIQSQVAEKIQRGNRSLRRSVPRCQSSMYATHVQRRAPAFTMRGNRSRMPYGFAWREATVGFHDIGCAVPLIHRTAPSFSMRHSLPERSEQSGQKGLKEFGEAEKAYKAAKAAAQHAEKNGLPEEMRASLKKTEAEAKAALKATRSAPKGTNGNAYSPPATLSRMRRAPSFTMGISRTTAPARPDPRPSHDASIDKATRKSSTGFTISATPRFKNDHTAVLGPGAYSSHSKQTGKAAVAHAFGPPQPDQGGKVEITTPSESSWRRRNPIVSYPHKPKQRASAAADVARAGPKPKLNAAKAVSAEAISVDVDEGVSELEPSESVSAL